MTTLAGPSIQTLSTSVASSRSCTKPIAVALVAAVFAVAIFSRLTYLALPFDGDGAMFAYMGKLVTEGGRFGQDLVDNKFPTVGLMTSPFYRLFGDWWPGYVIGQLVLALTATILLSRAAARAFGEHARWPTLLVALTLVNLNAAVMGGFQLETILAFFACIAACCGLEALTSRSRLAALACGMSGACAMLVKPTGICVVIAFLAAAILVVRSTRLSVFALLGCAIPIVGAVSYLIESQTIHQIPQIAAQIREYAANSSFAFEDLFRPFSVLALFAAALLVRGWVYRRPAFRVESRATKSVWVFAIVWLILELAGVLSQRRMYAYHFLPLAFPAALLFGALPRRATIGQLAGVLALPILLSAWGSFDTLHRARDDSFTAPQVAAWLDGHSLPGERIWRDDTPAVLIRSDLRSASRVQLTFLFMNSDDAPRRFSSMLIDDWKATRPTYIVLPRDLDAYVKHHVSAVFELSREPTRADNFAEAWGHIRTFVQGRYVRVTTIGEESIYESMTEFQR